MQLKNILPLGLLAAIPLHAASSETIDRLQSAATVVKEIMDSKTQSIPEDLLDDAHCAVVVPSLKKGAFIVSAKYGKGFITCRNASRGWTAPAAIRIEGGGFGFQIGGSETELILLVMNEQGAKRLMSSQFTLGGEGEVAAGPVGRNASAQTDAKFTAEILSWSRARGIFAGVALQGATLREDKDENKAMYGRELTTEEVIHGGHSIPAAARPLLTFTPRRKTSRNPERKDIMNKPTTPEIWMPAMAFLLGAVTGGIAGVLLAPYAGSETRNRLKTGGENLVNSSKERILDEVNRIDSALEAGKAAFRQSTAS